ncbi:MAG: iron ABC transporter permease [Candidatus Sumerlaeaceae bacterium]|nr:iron ABC transporter permease [Candidatus Sumerlaeaceae bacterium]
MISFARQPSAVMACLVVLLAAAATLSLFAGRYAVSARDVVSVLMRLARGDTMAAMDSAQAVLLHVRLPRIVAAIAIGGALSAAGAAYQGMFRNPMVSPDILGASAGACFGVALGILLGWPVAAVQAVAFVCGLAAVALTCTISSRLSRDPDSILVLVLAGIVVGAVFMSLVMLVKSVADPYSKLPAITFWLMGSLAAVTARDVPLLAVPILGGLVPLMLLRWRLNVLSLGDDEARALGVNTQRLRLVVVTCSTLMTAVTVAVGGVVGWVGLVIPHVARMLVGPDFRFLLPGALLLGGAYLLLVDALARSALATEIPLGILTSLIGAPVFIYLLARVKRGGWA